MTRPRIPTRPRAAGLWVDGRVRSHRHWAGGGLTPAEADEVRALVAGAAPTGPAAEGDR